ncbi:phage tail tube protein [Streptomonospora wellingtoniae]|uniref:Phage tail tube protein n=1 Tax=Streptomonospora wellingtoniae TaxID=3075544 RepID=A0ABU2L110_9ACTN|nr:phage tail tube protein [Streptomonospora sp. DSM 45055]MDT0305062.1 phage tail tube protein [Streptomonospora sp. DSM 45055]
MAGKDGFGTELRRDDGAGTFAPIGNVGNFGGPNSERETYDVTAHDSASNFREFIGGLVDGGEVSVEVHYDPAKHDTLYGDFKNPDPVSYEMESPEGEVWAFDAVLNGWEREMPVDGQMAATITWQVSGEPIITPAP